VVNHLFAGFQIQLLWLTELNGYLPFRSKTQQPNLELCSETSTGLKLVVQVQHSLTEDQEKIPLGKMKQYFENAVERWQSLTHSNLHH
jgi:hypothetical protein